ncbi:ead/Ea22-like family protein [Citrobacter koseri]|uniref:ead/Ea22-like family protein n=1 Tax=Citrobacter koseri TaxID=545 RepID=UPI0029421B88|nr:ead/Ea22-like family protein [Citrobacter koseri]WOJ00001.1 ead/Ea22-like family protein [Citrobacter koseri]
MSNIDKQALREAAEKALPAMKRLLMMPNDELFDEALLNVDGDVDAANAFNLLTGPEAMLALLDELEARDKQVAKDIEIKARLCRESNSLFDRLRAAEKRIAELENDCWIYEGTVKKLLERAESAEATKQKVVLPEPIGWKSPSGSEVIRKSDIISALSKAGIEIAAGIGKGE